MLHKPILSDIIDDAWRADRLIDLDIVLDAKQSKHVKLTSDNTEEEQANPQRVPIAETRVWTDNGISELITPLTQEHDLRMDIELPKIS